MVGIDLTEAEFDKRNAEITAQCKIDYHEDYVLQSYAIKCFPTAKGYWMRILEGYQQYFTGQELSAAVPYTPIVEEDIIIEVP